MDDQEEEGDGNHDADDSEEVENRYSDDDDPRLQESKGEELEISFALTVTIPEKRPRVSLLILLSSMSAESLTHGKGVVMEDGGLPKQKSAFWWNSRGLPAGV